MKTTLARHTAALIACASFGLASPALAQDKTVKIGMILPLSGNAASAVAGCGARVVYERPKWRSASAQIGHHY